MRRPFTPETRARARVRRRGGAHDEPSSPRAHGRGVGSRRDPTPVDCKYTGLRFVSQEALDYAAKAAK